MTRVFICLGANIGNRLENLRLALRYLTRRTRIVTVSSLYRSEAVVLPEQAPGPDFFNAVCGIDTALEPEALLAFVKDVEREIGRRPAERWAPRPIDIDILLFGEDVVETATLRIPHPLLQERNFVLVPLAEIAPDIVHPQVQRLLADLAAEVDLSGLSHVAGPEWADPATASFDTGDRVRWNDDRGGA
jgi:2-amino-4-hydroxy-6-hydroxymethyldihydropteridine diphosphokinase